MSGSENRHSQFVGWAKIVLPLSALALLSTLFLFARGEVTTSESFVAEVESIAREQILAAPAYSGVSESGARIELVARQVAPLRNQPYLYAVEDIALQMLEQSGETLDVKALTGEVDSKRNILHLMGLAKLWTSTGYDMETNGLLVQMDEGIVSSDSVLEVIAPFGVLFAGRVTYYAGETEAAQRILFTDGVRLLYTPQTGQTVEGGSQ